MLDRRLAFIDLETTGADPGSDRVTEIGIIETHGGRVLEEWSTLVNPGVPIPTYIAQMTGITDAMVADAPSFRAVAGELLRRIQGRLFIAHNARFDYAFLRAELHRIGIDLQEDVLCTVRLSRRLFPEHRSHGLDAIIERHGLDCAQRHRALGDAKVLVDFMETIRSHHSDDTIARAIAALVKRPVPAPRVGAELLDAIPEQPGVYRLYGEDGALLSVGSGGRLRGSVRDRLDENEGELGRAVRDVQWVTTAGDLGAALELARVLRTEGPPLARKGQARSMPWSLRLLQPEGSAALELIEGAAIDMLALERHFGLFRSARAARKALADLATAHGLCRIRLGLESPPGPCSAHGAGSCRGACEGTEPPRRHDVRLMTALSGLRLAAWPYRGRIGVREADRAAGRTDVHVFAHWCYVGTAKSDAELAELRETKIDPRFDPDTYRLLRRLLARRKSGTEIVELR